MYPYINTVGKLHEFIDMIPSISVPDSATTNWLPSIGFRSRNHRPIIKVLKFIGFLEGNTPTQRWKSFRDNTQAAEVMAEGIRAGYSDLFEVYNDAHTRSDEELKNYFKGKMTAGEQVVASTVSTFKTLCSFADFDAILSNGAGLTDNGDKKTHSNSGALASQPALSDNLAPALHIDIQVHISADAPPEQIDKIFESMAKHLYSKAAK